VVCATGTASATGTTQATGSATSATGTTQATGSAAADRFATALASRWVVHRHFMGRLAACASAPARKAFRGINSMADRLPQKSAALPLQEPTRWAWQ